MAEIQEWQKARIFYGFNCGCYKARRRAIESSAKHRITEHLPEIIRILETDTDEDAQLAAIRAIGVLGDKSHIPILERIMQSTPFEDFQQATLAAISQLQA